MSAILWRVILAVICVVLFWALLPPVMQVLGFPLGGPILRIVQVCVAGLAIFYILKGPPLWPPG